MAKDNRKKKKSCVPLDGYQAEQLARLIIAETERKVHYGTERKKRIAAPSGGVCTASFFMRSAYLKKESRRYS